MKQVIKFIPFVAASFIIASCGNNGVAHKVTLSSVHGEWHGAAEAHEGTNYTATFTPESGYELKGSDLYVKVSNNRLAENKDYTFYDNRLTILAGAITNDVTVTAKASAIEYAVINNLENATISTTKAYHNITLNLTVKPRDFYILPEAIKVYVGDEELKSGYTYAPDENLLTIEGEYVTGTITLAGKSYEKIDITFYSGDEGGWHESTYTRTKHAYIKKGSTFAEAVKQISDPTADSDEYDFDDWYYNGQPVSRDIIVEENFTVEASYRPLLLNVGGTSQSYFSFDWTGMLRGHETVPYGEEYNLTIDFLQHPEPKKNVVIPNDEYAVTFTGTGCDSFNLKDSYEEGADVSFQIIAKYGFDLPDAQNITVEGLNPGEYNYALEASSKMATFTCKMPKNEVKITVTATETKGRLYIMPEAIKITSTPRKAGIQPTILDPTTDYTIERTNGEIKLKIFSGVIKGDLTIEVNPYYEAEVVFDPGEGAWADGKKEPATATIKIGGRDRDEFNVLEALRIKAEKVEPTLNGKAFLGWKDADSKKDIDANTIIRDDMRLVADYGGIDFENDSWANVIENADKGLSNLVSAYNLGSADNLKGATRNIVTGNNKVGYYLQKAVVIGWEHDKIYDTTNEEKATLTFAFQKVFAESVFDEAPAGGKPRPTPNAWDGSYLATHMVSTLNEYVPDIANKLVKVEKSTYNASSKEYDLTEETFFPFSQNELNITSSSGSGVKIEGAPYAYFKDGGSLVRESVLVEDSSYWLRSAYLTDTPSTSITDVYYVDEYGNVKNDEYTQSHGLFVGFCIGQAQK